MAKTIFLVGIGVVVIVILLAICYVKAPPKDAFVISGLSRKPRILIGKGGLRIPGLERVDKVFLGQTSVDIKTSTPVPTNDFISVMVDAVAKIRVINSDDGIRLAAKNFLNMTEKDIASQIKDSLEGNMREIIGTLDLKSLNIDRDGFSDQIAKKAAPDMAKLGIEVISCNIQNITDNEGLIKNLGADNTFKIRKEAAITKAQAERDIAIAESEAAKEANDARVQNETIIAEKNNELAVKKANLKVIEDTQRAKADAAYEIQKQEQQKTVNEKTVEAEATKQILTQERQKDINAAAVEAETEKARKEQELTQEQVKIQQNRLEAEIQKTADAEKYQKEITAAAELEQRKRKAEAEAYEAEQRARAVKAQAEAEQFRMEQEAIGKKKLADAAAYEIEQKGLAEAAAIEKKGLAEAEAMKKKAEAFEKYGSAAKAQMVIDKLPEIAESVAKPISSIKDVRIYGGNGEGITQISGQVPTVIKQTMDTVADATGVDMTEIVKQSTLESAVKRTADK
ncbi:MAG: flotillin family protein [Bacteroidales bacterium]|nr:flotillin family protein [Bacteroidales bacterium]